METEYSAIFATTFDSDLISVEIPWDFSSEDDIKVWIISENGDVKYCDDWSYDGDSKTLTAYNDFGNWSVMIVRYEKASAEITSIPEGKIKVSDLVEQFKKDNRILEQLQDLQKRCLIVSGDEELNPLPFKENRANKILTFDENGQPNLSLGIESISKIEEVKQEVEGIRADTQIIYNNTNDVYEATSVLVEQAEQAKVDAEEAKQSALLFKIQAEQARNEAQEISDPENRIGALQETTQALQVFKSNSGALHCGAKSWFGKNSTTSQSTANITRSACCRIIGNDWEADSKTSGFINYLLRVGVRNAEDAGVILGYYGSYIVVAGAKNRVRTSYKVYDFSVFKPYLKADVNDFCLVFRTDADSVLSGDLYLNNVRLNGRLTNTFSLSPFHDAYAISAGGSTKAFTYKDVCVFNFDMSDANAPYTLADYQQGKPIPVECLDTSAEQRALLALENYTITNGATKQIFDYSGNANDATCTGTIKGDNDSRIQRLVVFIKA